MRTVLSVQELLFQEYVEGTEKKSMVYLAQVVICNLSAKVYKKLKGLHALENSKVLISSKVLKHIYDDHYTQHLKIIRNLDRIVRLPDAVYKNKPGRSGDYIFVKKIGGQHYCAVIDIVVKSNLTAIEIRTCFYASFSKNYLKECELVWTQKQ